MPKPQHKNFGIAGLAICALLASLLIPWAFHIRLGLTPLYWSGTGMLVTSGGEHLIYAPICPTMQRANGLQGRASLYMSCSAVTALVADGSFRGGWWSPDHASIEIGLLETQSAADALVGPGNRGAIDLAGLWREPELVLAVSGESPGRFRSGLRIEHASVTLNRSSAPVSVAYHPQSK